MLRIAKRFMTATREDAARCYSCGGPLGRYAWRYVEARLMICEACHQFTRRKESRALVDVGAVKVVESRPLSVRIGGVEDRLAVLEERVKELRGSK